MATKGNKQKKQAWANPRIKCKLKKRWEGRGRNMRNMRNSGDTVLTWGKLNRRTDKY